MKRIVSVSLIFLMLLSLCVPAFAQEGYFVYVGKVFLQADEPMLIPVMLKDNAGIMGFRIRIEYSPDVIEVTSVTKGNLTSKGNFNTNAGVNEGSVDVLWNNTENVTQDGTLFTVSAKLKDKNAETAELNLSYVQEDTFNESWDDVVLQCTPIILTKGTPEEIAAESSTDEDVSNDFSDVIDDTQIINAVDYTLDKYGSDSLDNISDEHKFLDDLNNTVQLFTNDDSKSYPDLDSLKSEYYDSCENVFSAEIRYYMNDSQLREALDKSFSDAGVKNTDNLTQDEKNALIEAFGNNTAELYHEGHEYLERIPTDRAIEIISSLDSQIKSKTGRSSPAPIILIVCLIVAAVCVASAVIIIQKKRHKSNSEQ